MVKYPGDWKKTTLGEEYVIIMGQSPASSSYNYSKNGLPLIQGNADIENGITSTQRYTSQPIKICDADSVIMSVRAPVGTVSRANQRVCLGRGVCAIVGKVTNFVYYLMKYHEKSWQKLEQGSTFTAVSGKVIRDFEIFIPSLEEQTAIADTLAAFDTHISNLTELISKKKAIREGALDELMTGRTRLKGFCGEWRDAKIGDILKILHGKDKRNVESPAGHYPILGTGGIIGKAIKPLCDWECVLIGRKGTIDRPYYMDKPFWSIDTLYYSKPEENQCVKYQYYLFCSINWYDYMESSGRPSLTRKAIENIKIKLPPLDEQTAIADTLTALDKEISSLEAERAKISHIRDGAMNDLLTGKVRLIHGNRKTAPEPRNSLADR